MNQGYFISGPIAPAQITKQISELATRTDLGAHNFFLGQVRSDEIDGKRVTGIDYSGYEPMAIKAFDTICAEAKAKFNLADIYILHSLGLVKAGEVSLFVCVTSKRRRPVLEGLDYIVEAIKANVPIFGKEILADASHVWKANT